MARLFLDHIDSQAAQIENRELVMGHMQEALTSQALQLEALKEALISLRAMWNSNHIGSPYWGSYDENDIKEWREEAESDLQKDEKLKAAGVTWDER